MVFNCVCPGLYHISLFEYVCRTRGEKDTEGNDSSDFCPLEYSAVLHLSIFKV